MLGMDVKPGGEVHGLKRGSGGEDHKRINIKYVYACTLP